MTNNKTFLLCLLMVVQLHLSAQEKTTFQTDEHWKPATDIRADAVMFYGAGDKLNRRNEKSNTFLLGFENNPDGVTVSIRF